MNNALHCGEEEWYSPLDMAGGGGGGILCKKYNKLLFNVTICLGGGVDLIWGEQGVFENLKRLL